MRYLLDTHTFLWWITDDSRLSVHVREIIRDPSNEILFSVASAWEITIKAQLGRFELPTDPASLIQEQLAANGFATLPIDLHHALSVAKLPLFHRDPFDRMLVAQALADQIPLLTADPAISQYDISVIW